MRKITTILLAAGILAGSFFSVPSTEAAAVLAGRWSDGSTVYYDDSSVYWASDTRVSVAYRSVTLGGNTTDGVVQFAKDNGVWWCSIDGDQYRPASEVPMGDAILKQLI